MNKFILPIFALFFISACGNTTKPTQTAPAPAVDQNLISLPPVTKELAQSLYETCDYIDIIMYKEGFSMNISQKPSIQTLVSGLSVSNPSLGSNCPARGRLFFQNTGQTIAEADLHFTSGVCAALVFYENGQKAYTSQMTEKGAGIFANYFQNAQNLQQQQVQ